MRLSTATLALWAAATVHAFRDTSPFLMLSNQPLPASLKNISTAHIQSSADVLNAAKSFLSACTSEKYYIISQPGLTSSTLSRTLPHLRDALNHESVQSTFTVPDVVGLNEGHRQELVKYIQAKCKAEVNQSFVEHGRRGSANPAMTESAPTIGGWTDDEKRWQESDPTLQSKVLKYVMQHYRYTFILLSTPSNNAEVIEQDRLYEASFNNPVHMDLRRNVDVAMRNVSKNFDNRPLFEKYQFLTPGLFMGLLVGLLLTSILGVGLRAISSLEVSYAAFDKEMGPAAQKKQ